MMIVNRWNIWIQLNIKKQKKVKLIENSKVNEIWKLFTIKENITVMKVYLVIAIMTVNIITKFCIIIIVIIKIKTINRMKINYMLAYFMKIYLMKVNCEIMMMNEMN